MSLQDIQVKQVVLTNKSRCKNVLDNLFLSRVEEAFNKSPKEYLTIKEFSEKICRCFSIPKADAIKILRIFETKGYFTLVKFGKIQLNYRVENVE